ncbi:MAG: ribosome biogenesis GTP-binding protein YihA/YsxC [Flavobacteriales bacterium]|jgi:GTP-binding protein|tara:strand:- start:1677 stop:2276 length:600 start_codon:yes stop_codon:yes gene_type:complete
MMIKKAEFVISNTDYRLCPKENLPEYAFIGRSNVGKSSLINALVNNKKLAKTSSTPGKTQLINHFIINDQWFLVDLPGYGYAKTSKTQRALFHEMISNYLLNRSSLVALFVLIDSRHKLQNIDNEFMIFLAESQIPFVIVFTKTDKLGKNILKKNTDNFRKEMLKSWEEIPKIFLTSSETKEGVIEITKYITKLNLNLK